MKKLIKLSITLPLVLLLVGCPGLRPPPGISLAEYSQAIYDIGSYGRIAKEYAKEFKPKLSPEQSTEAMKRYVAGASANDGLTEMIAEGVRSRHIDNQLVIAKTLVLSNATQNFVFYCTNSNPKVLITSKGEIPLSISDIVQAGLKIIEYWSGKSEAKRAEQATWIKTNNVWLLWADIK